MMLFLSEQRIQLLAVIPTLLSLLGSLNIIRTLRNSHFSPTAKKLLLNMGLCEVLSTAAFSSQSIFLGREDSHFPQLVLTDSLLSWTMQCSILGYLYSIIMSFVYLGVSSNQKQAQDFMQKRIEPYTPFLGAFYVVLSFLVGAGMRVYSEYEFDHAEASSSWWNWAEYVPQYRLVLLFVTIISNTSVMLCSKNPNMIATTCVLLNWFYTSILRIFESHDIRRHGSSHILVWLQAGLLPALGVMNLGLTWWWPRYCCLRGLYPYESNLWCARRVLGTIPPTALTKASSFGLLYRKRGRF